MLKTKQIIISYRVLECKKRQILRKIRREHVSLEQSPNVENVKNVFKILLIRVESYSQLSVRVEVNEIC